MVSHKCNLNNDMDYILTKKDYWTLIPWFLLNKV